MSEENTQNAEVQNETAENEAPAKGPIIKDYLGAVTLNEGESLTEAYDRVTTSLMAATDYDKDTVQITTNLATDDVPEGYDISVTGSRNKGEKNYSLVGIWVTPAMEALSKAKKTFVEDTVTGSMIDRLVDGARRFYKSDAKGTPELPFTPTEFVTKAAGGIQAVYDPAFNAMFTTFSKVLKARAKAYSFTKSDLHQALENKAFALHHFKSVEDSELFHKIIVQAIKRINEPGDKEPITWKEVSVNAEWFEEILETRKTQTYAVEEIIEADEDFSF